MVYSREKRVFILEHYFASKSSAAVREAFSNAYPDKEVPNKTIFRRVNKFRDTGSVCGDKCSLSYKNSWNYSRTDFKQRINCNNGIQLQEFNITIGFVALCLKGFMFSG
jgi:hypothetical protein